MQQFILRRLLLAVVTLIGVSWLIFAIMWMIPGDVAISILGDGANPERVAAAAVFSFALSHFPLMMTAQQYSSL